MSPKRKWMLPAWKGPGSPQSPVPIDDDPPPEDDSELSEHYGPCCEQGTCDDD